MTNDLILKTVIDSAYTTKPIYTDAQRKRAETGLPYEGPQPACVYVAVRTGPLKYSCRMVAEIPADIDLSTMDDIDKFMSQARRIIAEKIPPLDKGQIIAFQFFSGLDNQGNHLHAAAFRTSPIIIRSQPLTKLMGRPALIDRTASPDLP
jgi:hypothetical protein